jgi:Tfp pilus assembly protein PilZ
MSSDNRRTHKRVDDYSVFKYLVFLNQDKYEKHQVVSSFFTKQQESFVYLAENFWHIDQQCQSLNIDKNYHSLQIKKWNLLVQSLYPDVFINKTQVNISRGGIGISTYEEQFEADSQVHLMLMLSSNILPLFLTAKIVYCLPSEENSNLCRVGMLFDPGFEKEKQIIATHVSEVSKYSGGSNC